MIPIGRHTYQMGVFRFGVGRVLCACVCQSCAIGFVWLDSLYVCVCVCLCVCVSLVRTALPALAALSALAALTATTSTTASNALACVALAPSE